MTTAEMLRSRRDEILRIATEHGAHNVHVFGSVARGEARTDSDVDLLVELDPNRSLLDLGASAHGPAGPAGPARGRGHARGAALVHP